MFEKSTLFPRTFIGVISLVEKFTLFPRTFFNIILMVEKSTLFPRTFFDVICLVEICTLFLLTFMDVILMGKNLTSFLVSCQLMKLFEEIFPVFVFLPGVAQFHWNLSLATSTIANGTVTSQFSWYLQNTTSPNNFWAATFLWSHSCKKV